VRGLGVAQEVFGLLPGERVRGDLAVPQRQRRPAAEVLPGRPLQVVGQQRAGAPRVPGRQLVQRGGGGGQRHHRLRRAGAAHGVVEGGAPPPGVFAHLLRRRNRPALAHQRLRSIQGRDPRVGPGAGLFLEEAAPLPRLLAPAGLSQLRHLEQLIRRGEGQAQALQHEGARPARLRVAGVPGEHRVGELQRERGLVLLPRRERPGGVQIHPVRRDGVLQLRVGQERLVAREVGLGEAQVISPDREQQQREEPQGLRRRPIAVGHALVGMVARAGAHQPALGGAVGGVRVPGALRHRREDHGQRTSDRQGRGRHRAPGPARPEAYGGSHGLR